MFPLRHGEALAERISRGRLLVLEAAGHGVERADWAPVVPAILEHTAADSAGQSVSGNVHRVWWSGR
ncbi:MULTISPECIES: hypothetical protein [Streptomyces]|uniref:hypothetical protein n=1 Tax=Streptomyces TaxID=1883 RepID=UPI0038642D9E